MQKRKGELVPQNLTDPPNRHSLQKEIYFFFYSFTYTDTAHKANPPVSTRTSAKH